MKERVFIIDHELASPIALGRSNIIKSIKSNYSADQFILRTDTGGIPFKKGAEIQDDVSQLYTCESEHIKNVCVIDRRLELLVACCGIAEERMGKLAQKFNPQKTGVIMGVGAEATPYEFFVGEMKKFLHLKLNPINELMASLNKDFRKISRINNPYDLYAVFLAQKYKSQAFQKSVLTGCASSTQALAFAYNSISRNQVEVVIAGGTDSIINLTSLVAFGKLGVIAETDDRISCRPFDINRFGALAGEAAGFAVLASESFLNRTGIKPLAEITGYGNTLDGYKITAPDPSGNVMARAIKNAIDSSRLLPEQIEYINAHGTGTKQNDGVELDAIRLAFGDHANSVAISSTKDRHGHAIAAAGIQELSILLEAMKHHLLPGNLNLQNPINLGMNLLRENTERKIEYALTSNFAFGGINTVLAIKNNQP